MTDFGSIDPNVRWPAEDGPPVKLAYSVNTAVLSEPGLWTVDELFYHLYQAAFVEWSTIPLYLYAAYSIKGQSYSEWSPGRGPVDDFRTVVIEEMLHLCLVRNMIVSIGRGDDIRFYRPRDFPTYPSAMLHRTPRLLLPLAPLSYRLVKEVFMEVEKPQTTKEPMRHDEYTTLGQFYDSLRYGFNYLNETHPDLFAHNHPELQYGTAYWNEGGGGGPVVIAEQVWGPDGYIMFPIGAVNKAIDIIVEQGEGILRKDEDEVELCEQGVNDYPAKPVPGMIEYTHYAKFCRIATGLEPIGIALDSGGFPISLPLDQATWPVLYNPTVDQLDGPVHDLAEFFNAAYCYVLALIDEMYQAPSDTVRPNQRSRRYGLERTFITSMAGVLAPIAEQLVRTPSGIGERNAGPPFGYYRYQDGNIKEELMALCERSVRDFPNLGGSDGVRWAIGLMPDIEYAEN
ncbi:MAG TPA: ferritin-like domain-containing protein [Acidimicrobiales bacterium]|jgi:hypothetical protein|nr:ferritin-like domain-containing protein [Acidimicrobiales bacterium]